MPVHLTHSLVCFLTSTVQACDVELHFDSKKLNFSFNSACLLQILNTD